MLKLLRLEWKKNRISSYFNGLIICIVGIFAAVALMAMGSGDEKMFQDYTDFMSLTNILIRIVFIIFSSIILSRLVIDEYKNKTVQLLFTYPLKRKKIIFAKLSLVFGFCFFSIIIATFMMNIAVYYFNPMMNLFEAPIEIQEMVATIPSTFINAFMMAGVSLIPLYFGMRKKTTASTITSAVLIGFLINSTVSNGDTSASLFQFIMVPIIMCLLGLIIGYLSYYKVDKVDLI
ncbi:bacitracin ABC transporter permease [Lysinibacillus sphaericus]|uniref:ABC transporter permease n=1 Tax=Lysinibacillus sphaericus TaxID=1421 RepID=UPI0018CCAFF8|nr:ABC transporter permease [Lysinibacillus sphaericus]MBG9455567.1 bacitracin ABC transporter permease [Lysinibacillus sphaericus]MBG9477984.1 bacitracin ABC transporter permease [Lysinibacillus sphaericus]MBG9594124.1 bacitracin ABC transporter permease [Lysinibacillus sphaericus]